MKRIAGVFPVLLMLLLAAATLWLERLVQLPPPNTRDAQRHDPDFVVERFTITRMDKAGAPESTLSAARMVHFPDDETTDLIDPRFRQTRPGEPAIEVVSKRGTVTKDGDEVHLRDEVVVTRAGAGDRPPLRVNTEYLKIRPDDQVASTTEFVVITEGTTRLTGVGMRLDGRTRILEVESQVRGTFIRPPEGSAR